MELQLGLALSLNSADQGSSCAGLSNFHSSKRGSIREDYCSSLKRKRRSFDSDKSTSTTEVMIMSPTTLPLLSWNHNNQPNEDDHDEDDHDNDENHSSTDEADGMVGWPPIKSWRKKNQIMLLGGTGNRRRTSSKYVKVKMEGVAIARKIDLTQFNSLPQLLSTLLTMFGRGNDDQYSNYVITYQDKEGDWLLAHDDDVPWRLFVESVQRLKLERNLLD